MAPADDYEKNNALKTFVAEGSAKASAQDEAGLCYVVPINTLLRYSPH
jgi:hypothetical protein